MIPEDAIEAAAKAEYEHEFLLLEGTWADASKEARVLFRQSAATALEAAAPHMLAGAWDEGSVAGWIESGLPHSWAAENALVKANPYRSTV